MGIFGPSKKEKQRIQEKIKEEYDSYIGKLNGTDDINHVSGSPYDMQQNVDRIDMKFLSLGKDTYRLVAEKEKELLDSIENYKKRREAKHEKADVEYDVASACEYLARTLERAGEKKGAREYHEKAGEAYLKVAQKEGSAFSNANTYENAADEYQKSKKYKKDFVEELYVKSIKLSLDSAKESLEKGYADSAYEQLESASKIASKAGMKKEAKIIAKEVKSAKKGLRAPDVHGIREMIYV